MPTPKSEKTERTPLKAVEQDSKVLRWIKKLETLKQDQGDANTALMSEYKAAGEDQLNTAVLKLIIKLRKQDEQKTAIFLQDFVDHGIAAGFLTEDSKLTPVQGQLFQGKPAA